MRDIFKFVVACWSTGTLLHSICAIFVIPVAAWLAVRAIVPQIARLEADPGWQAPLAAVAAALPGALFMVLAVETLIGGSASACLDTLVGRFLFSSIVIVSLCTLGRALVLGARRSGEASTLIRWSRPAEGRLAMMAEQSGVAARTIVDERPFCALAGIKKPTVIVSTGALTCLSDRELRAALSHEHGHERRGDQIIAATLSFLVDLLPLPARDLVAMYRRAREIAADQHALQTAEAHDLAGALIAFAKRCSIATTAAALVGDGSTCARLNLLLRDTPTAQVPILRRVAIALTLATILGAGLAPASAALLQPKPCNMDVSRAPQNF